MAEASETSESSNPNSLLTRSLSNILYEDQLNMLMKKYDEIEDKSHLLPEVERAMQACLTIQELLQGESGSIDAHPSSSSSSSSEPSKKQQVAPTQCESSDSLLDIHNPSLPYLDEDEIQVDWPEVNGIGHIEVDDDEMSSQERLLEEMNPSLSTCPSMKSSTLSQGSDIGPSSPGFESHKSADTEQAAPHDPVYTEGDEDSFHGQQKPGRSKKVSIASLEAVNPSSEFKSREFPSGDLMSGGSSFSSNQREASMEGNEDCLLVANPSLDEFVHVRTDIQDLVTRSKFQVTLKPTSLHADVFRKIDLHCSTTTECAQFSIKDCHYTVPVAGNYQFCVRKLGHQNFQCCLRKDDGSSSSSSSSSSSRSSSSSSSDMMEKKRKSCHATSRWGRGNAKMVVNWECSAGQKVWVEGKGQTNDCGMAIVFSGALLD